MHYTAGHGELRETHLLNLRQLRISRDSQSLRVHHTQEKQKSSYAKNSTKEGTFCRRRSYRPKDIPACSNRRKQMRGRECGYENGYASPVTNYDSSAYIVPPGRQYCKIPNRLKQKNSLHKTTQAPGFQKQAPEIEKRRCHA